MVDEIYTITKQFPRSEIYVLASQMQRAAVSIPSNIAEGYQRNHKPEYVQFLSISFASAVELDTQLIITKRQYPNIQQQNACQLIEEIQKMLFSLIKKLKNH